MLCSVVTCDVLTAANDDTHLSTTNNTYNTTVVFWCSLGFEFYDGTTARSIKCLQSGNWSASAPECSGITCPEIELPSYSTRDAEERAYDTQVMYTCDSGKRMLDGAPYRTIRCDATGEWSDDVTDCRCKMIQSMFYFIPARFQ